MARATVQEYLRSHRKVFLRVFRLVARARMQKCLRSHGRSIFESIQTSGTCKNAKSVSIVISIVNTFESRDEWHVQ